VALNVPFVRLEIVLDIVARAEINNSVSIVESAFSLRYKYCAFNGLAETC